MVHGEIKYVSVHDEVGYKRKMDGTSVSYLQEREKLYSSMQGDNVEHIDGTISIEDIQKTIEDWVTPRLKGNKL